MRCTVRKLQAALVTLGTVGALAGTSNAQVFDSDGVSYEPPEPERRFGFMFGLSYMGGIGSTTGYPNKLGEIGDPDFEQQVAGFAVANSIWLGGALRDWISFGLGLSSRVGTEDDLSSQNGAFVLHLEGFPLFPLGGAFRDLGILTEFGAGGSVILDQDQEDLANGGSMSVVGVGLFWEPWQFWHFSTGPVLQYTHEFSQSMTSNTITLGIRTALYGVQPDD